ncbi:MAG: hypothetical protein OEV40_11735 [Acidimicrobiia bacterium]|nr:hypothetical protein [Acidimicrobiia bacterium]
MTSPDESPLPDSPDADDQPLANPGARPPIDRSEHATGSSEIESRPDDSPLLYTDLDAPKPSDADPPPQARWLAFGSILLGGLLGGLIGYGTGDLMSSSSVIAALGAVGGAALGALGVGVVAGLTLRAMNEWHAVEHPESETRAASGLVLRTPEPEHETSDRTDPVDDGADETA